MINSVRNTVLSVANKNNYGYISPQDFNLYAKQAQMEVYEEYYSNYNKVINMENARMSGTDYSDIEQPIAEVMETFLTSDFVIPISTPSGFVTNQYYAPSMITVGNDYYMINKVLCYTKLLVTGVNSNTLPAFTLIDPAANYVTAGVSAGDILVNLDTFLSATVTSVVNSTTLTFSNSIFSIIGNNYAIYSASTVSEAEKVSVGKITMLNASLLTAPSTMYPAYTMSANIFSLYPNTIKGYGVVNAVYFRYPKDPKWTYITLANGEPVFDQTQLDYQDFEVPLEDEYKLCMKILQYCGMSIRENELVQFGMAQEQHEQPTFSQQQ
jgi:hypothetical protein